MLINSNNTNHKIMLNKILVRDEPIKHFFYVCLLSILVSFGSGFIGRSISLVTAIFGYSLIVMRQFRFDKRRGLNPLAFSRKQNKSDSHQDFNKQEMQLATLGVIMFILSLISGGIAPYVKPYIMRLIGSA